MGTGSLYKTSRGSRATHLQNASCFDQCSLAAADLLVKRPFGKVVQRSAEDITETSALGGVRSGQDSLYG